MKVYESYNVLGHEVDIVMESTNRTLQEFACKIRVDGGKTKNCTCTFGDNEKLKPEKVLVDIIEGALSYEKSPDLGKFIKNGDFNGSEQEINAGDILFRDAKSNHKWLSQNFSMQEMEDMFKAIEPDFANKTASKSDDNLEEGDELTL